ncbi:hypothetical protein [Comamonas sp.]
MLHRESFRCFHRLRMRWAEVDAQTADADSAYALRLAFGLEN